jgi:uncharacterized protein involved in high-affinity Fe2+ transport
MIGLIHRCAALPFVVAAVVLAVSAPAVAQDVSPYKVVRGLAVYLGVMPAELIVGHAKGHVEAEMHGGAPAGPHSYHVMVAIFDDASGQRITDAVVTARVAGVGLAGRVETLEPMTVADALTYGAYFKLPGRDRYRVRIEIARPGTTRPVNVEFGYDHQL